MPVNSSTYSVTHDTHRHTTHFLPWRTKVAHEVPKTCLYVTQHRACVNQDCTRNLGGKVTGTRSFSCIQAWLHLLFVCAGAFSCIQIASRDWFWGADSALRYVCCNNHWCHSPQMCVHVYKRVHVHKRLFLKVFDILRSKFYIRRHICVTRKIYGTEKESDESLVCRELLYMKTIILHTKAQTETQAL